MVRWNRFLVFGALLSTFALVSCLFDETSNASAWMSKTSKAPTTIKSDTLIFDNVKPLSVTAGSHPTVLLAMTRGGFGFAQGSRQDIFLSILETDTNALKFLGSDGAGKVGIQFALDSAFYTSMPQMDSLPFFETSVARFWWHFEGALTTAGLDSAIADTSSTWIDSTLMRVANDTITWDSASMPLALALDSVDKRFTLTLPDTLRNLMSHSKGKFHLQLRVSLDRTQRVYRIQGPRSANLGLVRLAISHNDSIYKGNVDSLTPVIWMAQVGFNTETSSDHLILHSGVNDSLRIEFPTDMIWNALKAKLGDSLSVAKQLDSIYSNQLVLMAMLEMPADANAAHAETGLPIPVSVISLLDSVDHAGVASIPGGEYIEARRIDTADVEANGQPNLLFYPARDSLHLQITEGVRHWLTASRYYADSGLVSSTQKVASSASKVGIHTVLKMSSPMQSPKDVSTSSYSTITGTDTVNVQIYSSFASYSRWDLGLPADQRYRLRIWITEKR